LLDRLSYGEFNRHFRPTRTEFDWLSRDQDEVDKYDKDPLMGFSVSTQTWLDLLTALERIAKPHNVGKIPQNMMLYLITGAQDSVTNFSKGTQNLYGAYKKTGIKDVRMRIYPGGRHEMFNETNQQEVTDDFVDLCDAVIKNL
jgi:alpha-beta hydrolase superfamily lysophospholipase